MRIQYLLLIIFLTLSCKGLPLQDKPDYYDLNFSGDRKFHNIRWFREQRGDSITSFWDLDSKELVENKAPFRVKEFLLREGYRPRLFAHYTQKITLCSRDFKNAQITINNRGNYLQEAWLKVTSLGIHEETLRTDSVDINTDGVWRKSMLSCSLEDVQYLRLSILVSGKEYCPDSAAEMLLDRMTIKIDGRDINEVNPPGYINQHSLDTTKILPLSLNDYREFGCVPEFQKKTKIVGLGETIHGCSVIQGIIGQGIKQLVEKNDCKLIMWELPSMLVLKVDLYIQGYPIALDEIMEDMLTTLSPWQEMSELLQWLKEYNRTAIKKVRMVGIDRSTVIYTTLIKDYLYELYQQNSAPLIRQLMLGFPDGHKLLPLLVPLEGANVMGSFNFLWFRHVIWLYLAENEIPGVKEYGVLSFRDYIMWVHAKYALKAADLKEGETAVVVAHYAHVNKLDMVTLPLPSLGYYFTQVYGEDYCAIGLLGGRGEFNTMMLDATIDNCKLTEPVANSLEWLFDQTGKSFFYYPGNILPVTPIGLRFQTAIGVGNFLDFALKDRTDGFWFMRDCPGTPIPDKFKSVSNIMKWQSMRAKRAIAREQELKEKGF